MEFRFLRARDDGGRVIDDFDDLARYVEAEARAVGLVELVPQPVGGAVLERVDRDRQFELVVLPEITHFQRAEDVDVLLVALRLQLLQAFAHQPLDDVAGAPGLEALAGELRRAVPVDARIRS